MKKETMLKGFDAVAKKLNNIDSFLHQDRIIDSYKEVQKTMEDVRKLRAGVAEADWFCIACGSFNTSSSYPLCESCGVLVSPNGNSPGG